jgi:hypothetical protein
LYKNSKLAPSSTAPCATKHHVDTSDLLPVAALLKLERMATSEYRLQCGMCSNDVIGLRFSCIHCPGGLELCVDCAVRPDVKHHGGGSGPHAFQIYNSDQNPPTKPQARCGICYDAKWSGRKVPFNYMNCAECRTQLADELLVDSMKEHLELKARVEKMCVEKCVEDEVIHGLEELFAADPKAACAAALDKLTVLQCSACSQPFCGGRIDCQEDDSLDITRIRCAPCAFEVQEQLAAAERKKALEAAADLEAIRQLTTGWKGACRKHGFKSAIYKCDSCCAVAVFDCRTNHYCDRCHAIAGQAKDFPCPGPLTCPLGMPHPKNGTGIHQQVDAGFVIGCSKCFTGSDDWVDPNEGSVSEQWKDRFEQAVAKRQAE